MNLKTLEEKIDGRVQQQVEEDVRVCRKAIYDAICRVELDDFGSLNPGLSDLQAKRDTLLAVLNGTAYPRMLWTKRKEKLTAEVLATMDSLQRILLTQTSAFDPEVTPVGSELGT